MAEATDDIELIDLDREQEAENNEGEEEDTGFNNDRDESILIIDGSNPVFTRPNTQTRVWDSVFGVPLEEHIIQDTKEFLKDAIGLSSNREDGPNSTILYDNLLIQKNIKTGKINGAIYKGKKILVSKKGKMEYSKNKSFTETIDEFLELITRVKKEHQKTPAVLVEEREGVDLPQNVMDDIISNVSERLESTIDERVEDIEKNIVMTKNELRELRGILYVRGENDEEKIDFLRIEGDHWREMAQREKDNDDNEKSELYEAFADTADLKADELRLRLNLKPQSEEVISMLEEEAHVNDLTKFEKFKKWARNNLGSLSAISISIAGILTTIIMAGRNAIKGGAQAVSKFAKAVANLAKKFGPVLGAIGNLIAKVLTLGAKGILWLSQNLWLLALALTYFVYNEYKDYRRKKKP